MPIRVHLRCLVLALLATACVTMPPPVMPLEGASRDPVGSTSVRGYAVYGGDLVDRSVALGGRVTRQIHEDLSLGGEVLYGRVIPREREAALMFGGRAHLKFNPGTDYFALTGGLGVLRFQGLSSDGEVTSPGQEPQPLGTIWSATTVLAGDVGFRASTGRRYAFEPYVGASVAWEQFIANGGVAEGVKGSGMGYITANLGVAYRPRSRLSIGADVGILLQTFTEKRFNAMDRPKFFPTLSVAYRFGGEEGK